MPAPTRRTALAAAAIVLLLSAHARASGGATASIDNFSFTPPTLTVAVHTKVTWTNHDDIPHTVTSADEKRAFQSDPLDTNDSFSVTFDTPGTFSYFCALHPHMQGMVVVK